MILNTDKYNLIQKTRIEELRSDGFLLKHKKSGARVVVLSNDDDNKVFSIGFRTPPPDSTGVPHILEHSVLCGSDKYPAKDPFVELAKGSLNTFLNAMTYPDKTVYPVASCNDADFKNLMDVYMDAVLHPNIYKKKEIFLQEGWHYEMENADSPLTYNGVVYNEMKGAFSSPDDVLARYCLNSLYPDNAYAVESGGDPECIPVLSYEKFLEFHKKLYHPSNSYIYIYGNCDMNERLEYLDREYLSNYDYLEVDSEIGTQKAFEKMARIESEYPVSEEEGTENKTYLAYNISIADSLDPKLYVAFQILEYALFSAPGAPVKQALTDAGIGEDISACYDNGVKQPLLTISAKNTEASREQEFLEIINNTLKDIVKSGINKDALKAGINSCEFRYREADFGRYPKGLMYGLNLMDSWLYDDEKPFIHIQRNDTYKFLRDNIDTGYFEQLIQEYILDNTHSSMVVLKPAAGLTTINEKKTADKLAAYKASLSSEDIERIVRETAELKKYQTEPSSEEDLAAIPMLTREDMSMETVPIYNDVERINDIKVAHHDIYTNGIGYLELAFSISNVLDEDIPYVGLLNTVIGYIDTNKHKYDDLSNEIDIHTGGIFPTFYAYSNFKNTDEVTARFSIKSKAFIEEFPKAVELIEEMMYESKYDDHKRLKEILAESKARIQGSMLSSGHSVAVNECNSQMSELSRYSALTSGVPYYRFICDLYDNFDARKDEITKKLNLMAAQIFVREKLVVSFTADKESYSKIKPYITEVINRLPKNSYEHAVRHFIFEKKKIGYKTSSQVNYVALCGNFRKYGYKYDSALKVLKTMMGYGYLWNNVRVLGGAYGCMNGYSYSGQSYFVSYRDPHISETLQIYKKAAEYIRDFKADEREMTKYIIGTFSDLDAPLSPSAKGDRSFDALLRHVDEDYYRKDRKRIIETTQEDINALASVINSIIEDNYMCVIGNSDTIEREKDIFDEVANLI